MLFLLIIDRNDRSQIFLEIGFFKNIANFTGKHLCWVLFLIKRKTCNFLKKRLQHKCFSVKFVKNFRTPFFYRTHVAAFALTDYLSSKYIKAVSFSILKFQILKLSTEICT